MANNHWLYEFKTLGIFNNMGKSCVAIDTLIFERVSLDQKMAGKQGFRSKLSGNWDCQMVLVTMIVVVLMLQLMLMAMVAMVETVVEEKVALAYSGSGNF